MSSSTKNDHGTHAETTSGDAMLCDADDISKAGATPEIPVVAAESFAKESGLDDMVENFEVPVRDLDYEETVRREAEKLAKDTYKWTANERHTFIKSLRFAHCTKPDYPLTYAMVKADGDLNEGYCRLRLEEGDEERVPPVWGDAETAKLLDGLRTFGVGNFKEIRSYLLPEWHTEDLLIQAMRMLGTMDVTRYVDLCMHPGDIEREYQRNERIGLATGHWIDNMLPSENILEVQQMIKETEPSSQPDADYVPA